MFDAVADACSESQSLHQPAGLIVAEKHALRWFHQTVDFQCELEVFCGLYRSNK